MLPPHAFGGRGPKTGPDIFMTDDDSGQRGDLLDTWKEAIQCNTALYFPLPANYLALAIHCITPATT